MISIKYYEVYDRYDPEGKGPIRVIGRFANELDAKKYSKNKGNYGDANTREITLHIAESIEEKTKCDEQDHMEKALSKLTSYEKSLLGLIS